MSFLLSKLLLGKSNLRKSEAFSSSSMGWRTKAVLALCSSNLRSYMKKKGGAWGPGVWRAREDWEALEVGGLLLERF